MSLIQRFMTGKYQVTRSGKGYYRMGQYSPGEQQTFIVRGSLQPTTAREMKLPEEGNRIRQLWKFYSDQKIVTSDNSTMANADIVSINGETYRAMGVMRWEGTDLDYFMTVLWREPEQSNDGQGN